MQTYLLEQFAAAGWQAEAANACTVKAEATTTATILERAVIDTLPAAPTIQEGCTIAAH